MEPLRTQFEAYGADYDMTMARFMGNEAMYLKILGMLFQDESVERLGRAVASGDISAAFQAAHTLKGVAGNLGLTPLYEAVCMMVEPLRRGDCLDDGVQFAVVRQEMERAAAFYGALKGEG